MNVQSTTCSVSETLPVWDLSVRTNCESFNARSANETFQRESLFAASSQLPTESVDLGSAMKTSKTPEMTKPDSYLSDDDRHLEDASSCFEVIISVDNEAQSGQNIVLRTIDDDERNVDDEKQVRNCDDNDASENIKKRFDVFSVETSEDSNVYRDGVKTTFNSNGVSNLNSDESSRDAWHPRVGVFDKFYESELNVTSQNGSVNVAASPATESANERMRNKSSDEKTDADFSMRGLSSDQKRMNGGSDVERPSFKRFSSDDLMDDDVESDEDRLVVDMDVDDEVSLKSHKLIDKDNLLCASNIKQFEHASNAPSDNVCLTKSSLQNITIVSTTPSDVHKPSTNGSTTTTTSIRSSLKRLNFKPLKKLIGNMCIPSSSFSTNHVSLGSVGARSTSASSFGLCSTSTSDAIDSSDSTNGFANATRSPVYAALNLSVSDANADGLNLSMHLSPSFQPVTNSSLVVERSASNNSMPVDVVSECDGSSISTSIRSIISTSIQSTLQNQTPVLEIDDATTVSSTDTIHSSTDSSRALFTVSLTEQHDFDPFPIVSSALISNSNAMTRLSEINYSPSMNDTDVSLMASVNGVYSSLNVSIPARISSAETVIETATVSPFIDSNSFEMVSPRVPITEELLSETVSITDNPSTVIGVGADGIIGSTLARPLAIATSIATNDIDDSFSSALPLSSSSNVYYPAQIVSTGTTVVGSSIDAVDSSLIVGSLTTVISPKTCGMTGSDSPTQTACVTSIFTTPSRADGLTASEKASRTTDVALATSSPLTIGSGSTDDSELDVSKAVRVVSEVDTLPTVDCTDSLPTINCVNALPIITSVDIPTSMTSSVDKLPAVSSIETQSAVGSVNSSPRFVSTFVSVHSPITNAVCPLFFSSDLPVIAGSSVPAIPTNAPSIVSSTAVTAALSVDCEAMTDDRVILTKDSTPRNKRKASAQTVLNDPDEDEQNFRVKQEKLDDGYEQSALRNTTGGVPAQVSKPVASSRNGQKVTVERIASVQPRPIQPNLLAAVAAPRLITSPGSQSDRVQQIRPNSEPTIGIPAIAVCEDPRTLVYQSARSRTGVATPRGRPPQSFCGVLRPRLSFHTVTFSANGKQSNEKVVVTTSSLLNRLIEPDTVSSPMSLNVVTQTGSSVERCFGRNSTELTNAASPAASISQSSVAPRINSVFDGTSTSTTKSSQDTNVTSVGVSPSSVFPAKPTARAVSRARSKKNHRRALQFWSKFKNWFKSNALDAKLTPLPASADLHLPAITVRRVCECGDEFTTAAGLEDHYARKSFAVSFTCRCDRVARTFYNMCAYASFYKSHIEEPSAAGHSSAPSCAMGILPAAEMPEVYTEMARKREERKKANAVVETSTTAEVTEAASVAVTEAASVAASVVTVVVTEATVAVRAPSGVIATSSLSLPVTVNGNEESLDGATGGFETPHLDWVVEPPPATMESVIEVSTGSVEAENIVTAEKLAETINNRIVRCSECPTICRNRASLKVHFARTSHGGPANGKVMLGCKGCAMIVPNMCAMRAHMRLHCEDAQILCCPECGLRFKSTKEVFMKHVEQVCLHYARAHGSECPKCQEMCAPAAMTKHLIERHSTAFHKCGSCTRAFTSEDAFARHNADRHDGGAVRQTISKCPICEMVKSSVDELETHVNQHIKEKQPCKTYQLSCFVCKKGQQGRTALIKHMVTEHRDRIITDQMCEVCGDQFGAEDTPSLYAHMLAEHREYAISVLRSNIGASAVQKKFVSIAPSVSRTSSFTPSSASVTASQSVAAVANEASSEDSANATASGNDTQYGCDRCQMTFKTELRWKRHHAKHEYLATKRLTVESGGAETMSVSSSQGLKVKITLAKGKGGKTNASKSDERLEVSQDTSVELERSTPEGRGKVNSLSRREDGKGSARCRGDARKSPSSQAGVGRNASRSPGRSPENDAVKKTAGKSKIVDGKSKKVAKIQPAAAAQPKFSCEECNLRFSSEGEWKAHERASHRKMSWFSCHLCEVSFKSSASLQSHLKEKHSGKVRQHAFICWVCRDQGDVKSYPRSGMLAKHIKTIHKISRTHPEFAKIKELETSLAAGDTPSPDHVATATASTEVRRLHVALDDTMSYACVHCEFTASERAEFAAHIEAEHRERDANQCQECGASFSVLPALRRHLFAVHRVRDFDRYCAETGVQLETVDDVTDVVDGCTLSMEAETHEVVPAAAAATVTVKPKAASPRVVAPNSPVPFEGRFECTVCYRTFDDEMAHRAHMRVHGMAFIQRTRRSISSAGSAETVA